MKGKDTFTKFEIEQLRSLIQRRISAEKYDQKKIRDRMRNIGFYGKENFGITNLQPDDFEQLIATGKIKICDSPNDGISVAMLKLNDILDVNRTNLEPSYDLEKFQMFSPYD